MGNTRRPFDVAQTTAGSVKGSLRDNGRIADWRGIPYAAPPVGELRWRPPQPPEPWEQIKTCTKFGKLAFARQAGFGEIRNNATSGLGLSRARRALLHTGARLRSSEQSEDCLTLNVRAPAGASGLPVMVWYHGGNHSDGAGSDPLYDSNVLPERGCVLVTCNYRLGLFGFFAHPLLSAESPEAVSGNYGLLDQVAVLEWVQDNIVSFGGDPTRVTIFGESAGGQAVLNLMSSPRAQGLFHRAIAQSPSDSGRWLYLRRRSLDFESAETAGELFAERAFDAQQEPEDESDSDSRPRTETDDAAESGSETKTESLSDQPALADSDHWPQDGEDHLNDLARLRSISAQDLMNIYRNDHELGRYFFPAVDGVVLPVPTMSAFSLGMQAPVPLIIGHTANESSVFRGLVHPAGAEFPLEVIGEDAFDADEVRATFERSYPTVDHVNQLMAHYPGLEELDSQAIDHHFSDHQFSTHVEHVAREHYRAGHPVYRYHFRAVPPSPKQTIGAYHSYDVLYVFDSSYPLIPEADDKHLLVREVGDRWFAFAATGVPNSPGRRSWPVYDQASPYLLVLDRSNVGVERCIPNAGIDLMRQRIAWLTELHWNPQPQLEPVLDVAANSSNSASPSNSASSADEGSLSDDLHPLAADHLFYDEIDEPRNEREVKSPSTLRSLRSRWNATPRPDTADQEKSNQ